jgi:hypothetical protein
MTAGAVLFLLVGATAALGCSEVVIDPAGDGGRGASDGDDDGDVSSNASSSTGTDPSTVDAFCAAVGQCFGSCQAALATFQVAPCEAEGLALAECLIAQYDAGTCSLVGCDAQKQALAACRSSTTVACFGGGMGSGPDNCASSIDCPDGERGVICAAEGGELSCGCYVNHLLLGTCTAPLAEVDMACSVSTGCCASVLGVCSGCF